MSFRSQLLALLFSQLPEAQFTEEGELAPDCTDEGREIGKIHASRKIWRKREFCAQNEPGVVVAYCSIVLRELSHLFLCLQPNVAPPGSQLGRPPKISEAVASTIGNWDGFPQASALVVWLRSPITQATTCRLLRQRAIQIHA